MNLLSERSHGNKKVVWCTGLYTAVPVVEDVEGRWAVCPPVARASTQLLLLMTQDLKHINARIHEEVEFLREANKGGEAAKAARLTGTPVSYHNRSDSSCRSMYPATALNTSVCYVAKAFTVMTFCTLILPVETHIDMYGLMPSNT